MLFDAFFSFFWRLLHLFWRFYAFLCFLTPLCVFFYVSFDGFWRFLTFLCFLTLFDDFMRFLTCLYFFFVFLCFLTFFFVFWRFISVLLFFLNAFSRNYLWSLLVFRKIKGKCGGSRPEKDKIYILVWEIGVQVLLLGFGGRRPSCASSYKGTRRTLRPKTDTFFWTMGIVWDRQNWTFRLVRVGTFTFEQTCLMSYGSMVSMAMVLRPLFSFRTERREKVQ
jgi:hypothetical protein